jgi:hypothetical protein
VTFGFTSCPKEGVLRIFIALKNRSPRPGLNPQTLGSSGKHTNHYTTEATLNWNSHVELQGNLLCNCFYTELSQSVFCNFRLYSDNSGLGSCPKQSETSPCPNCCPVSLTLSELDAKRPRTILTRRIQRPTFCSSVFTCLAESVHCAVNWVWTWCS